MKKFGFVFIFIAVVAGALFFWMNTLVPKKLERLWNCEILNIDQKIRPASAEIELSHIEMQSLKPNRPAWKLKIEKARFELEYASLFQNPLIINRLTFDQLRLKVDTRANPHKKAASHTQNSSEKQLKQDPLSKKQHHRPKRILVRHLAIRGGFFELSDTDASGHTRVVKLENIHLNKRNILLGNRLDTFFSNLLQGMAPLTSG